LGQWALMDELKTWLDEQLVSKQVEPNSSLGEAIVYMQKRWDKLTLFLREPSAPLDNNICERALKTECCHFMLDPKLSLRMTKALLMSKKHSIFRPYFRGL